MEWTKWFYTWWWKLLLAKPAEGVGRLYAANCRATGHKCGVVWYNLSDVEPNMHCKNCHDNLG